MKQKHLTEKYIHIYGQSVTMEEICLYTQIQYQQCFNVISTWHILSPFSKECVIQNLNKCTVIHIIIYTY